MFNRIQRIGAVYGSNNLIINGDVVANGDILPAVAAHLFRPELEQLTREARKEMQDSIDECVQAVLERVVEKRLEEKLTEFSRPGTQWAFYSTLKGYSISETMEQREMMVDSMIDRIQENWDSPDRLIIDNALEVLPKLTPSTLSTIGLLQLRHQMTTAPFAFMLEQYFASLTPLAEHMAAIKTLEVDYLKQEKLLIPIPGLRTSASLETILLTNYDLFFRKPLADGIYEDYCREHPEAHEAVADSPASACMMWVNGMANTATAFCCPNSNLLKRTLTARNPTYIIPHMEALKAMMPPFSEEDVRTYFCQLTPVWDRLFKLFASSVLTQYMLSITGNYIGGKVLAKASHGTPLALSNYNKELL